MINKEVFEKLLFEGLKKSYLDSLNFSGNIDSDIKPEYLVTVNIAKKICTLNTYPGEHLIIKMEENTYKFAMSCVPLLSKPNSIFDSKVRGFLDTENRSGKSANKEKIDIAVYQKTRNGLETQTPYTVVEIKPFIKGFSGIEKDLIRNFKFHTLEDQKTGKSRLDQSYIAALYKHKNCLYEKDKIEKISKIKKEFAEKAKNKIKKHAKTSDHNIEVRIEVETISKNLLSDEVVKNLPQELSQIIYEEAYHYIGILTILEKRK